MGNTVEKVIKDSLEKAISYVEYRELVDRLVKEEATTGNNQSKDYINYTVLNQRRYKRLDKTLKLSDEDANFFSSLPTKMIWLVVTEAWCGDTAQILPMLNKLALANENIEMCLVLRDQNDELMEHFLTGGSKSIPKLIILDSDALEVIHTWGPRPNKAILMAKEYKEKHGELTAEFKEGLQRWYNEDKGQSIVQDLKKLFR